MACGRLGRAGGPLSRFVRRPFPLVYWDLAELEVSVPPARGSLGDALIRLVALSADSACRRRAATDETENYSAVLAWTN
ncbi:MAG: hypothetical protein ACI8U3_001810 [Brevundimonas sp.]|jgi:hypothetical protein